MKDQNKYSTNTDASAGGAAAAASAAAFIFTTAFTVVATVAAAEAAEFAAVAEASVLVKLLFSSFVFHFHSDFDFLINFTTHGTLYPTFKFNEC